MKRLLLGLLLFVFSALPAAAGTSVLYIAEFESIPIITNVPSQIALLPPKNEQIVDFTAGAAQSSALGATTRYVLLNCYVRCSIKIETGSSTVATTNLPLAADAPQYFAVPFGQGYKISVIASP